MVDETGLDEPKVDETAVDDQDHTRLSCRWKTPARSSNTRCILSGMNQGAAAACSVILNGRMNIFFNVSHNYQRN